MYLFAECPLIASLREPATRQAAGCSKPNTQVHNLSLHPLPACRVARQLLMLSNSLSSAVMQKQQQP